MSLEKYFLAGLFARWHYFWAERQRRAERYACAHNQLAKAARLGHAPAQYALGQAYQKGLGCARSGASAYRWLHSAASNGHIDAQFELGLILLAPRDLDWLVGESSGWIKSRGSQEEGLVAALFPAGLDLSDSVEKGFLLLQSAAENGKPEAQANVGWLLLKGLGCVRDRGKAFRYLKAAADHNISQAALGLCDYYSDERAEEYDPACAANWALKASKLGNASGSYRYGLACRDRIGVEANASRAELFFEMAVRQGHPHAAYELALLAIGENTAPTRYLEILEWLRLSGKRKHAPSALLLGDLYRKSDTVPADYRESAVWYSAAAELGSIQAQFMLGCCYARGEGVYLDFAQAAQCFKRAALAGHAEAAYNLGIFHLKGDGVDRNVCEAKRWLLVGANADLPQALYQLGQMSLQESGSPAQVQDGRKYLERAASKGHGKAKVRLSKILLSEQKIEAVRQAKAELVEAMSIGEIDAFEIFFQINITDAERSGALSQLRQLSESGSLSAKVLLAAILLQKLSATTDASIAIQLLREAASSDSAQAHFLLGVICCQGRHVVKDLARGFQHYYSASCLGHPIAQYNSGIMLYQGVGVAKDIDKSIYLIRRAAECNVAQARDFLQQLEAKGATLASVSADKIVNS